MWNASNLLHSFSADHHSYFSRLQTGTENSTGPLLIRGHTRESIVRITTFHGWQQSQKLREYYLGPRHIPHSDRHLNVQHKMAVRSCFYNLLSSTLLD
ncbi:hypothetical protein V3C99_003101 [Haemonchus contortus]|uniref:Uncharacterized protein n=1 Tax=Haemonchus contortus TaxID=6289 RepID=A0A7I4Y9X3_HAECO